MPEDRPALSERALRQIERLLDQAEEAIGRRDWDAVEEVAAADPENADALTYRAMAEQGRSAAAPARPADDAGRAPAGGTVPATPAHPEPVEGPTSFCDGRYEVKHFLGEGGKKRVYLAHDTKLDRDVAFALIKTDGLDEEGLLRIRREAQAMAGWATTPTSSPSSTSGSFLPRVLGAGG